MIEKVIILDLNPTDVLVKCESVEAAEIVARYIEDTQFKKTVPEHHLEPTDPVGVA